jgi:enoyl-[acyl-carrier protein] reductase I
MLQIDLTGKRAFVAGIADDKGYGWAIAKALHQAGANVCVGVWPPMLGLFMKSIERGKFKESAVYPGGELSFEQVYAMDALFDTPGDVPRDIADDRRYKEAPGFTLQECAEKFQRDYGEQSLDILVHSIANGPEVKKQLLDTSRKGYLTAVSASAYSLIALVQRLGPLMRPLSAAVSLSFVASERVFLNYGGGMNSAKAALESDTRMLAFEAGRKWGLRINTISAGPLASRAAKALGSIENMIEYYEKNSALPEVATAEDVANVAAFLCSPLAAGITGSTVHVDKGYHVMGISPECVQRHYRTRSGPQPRISVVD